MSVSQANVDVTLIYLTGNTINEEGEKYDGDGRHDNKLFTPT